MTLRVRALSEEEGHRLARMTRSQKLGAGLVRRAQIIQHAVDGLSAPGIAAKMGLGGRQPTPPRSAARLSPRRCRGPLIWACRSHRGRWTAWWPIWARRALA